MRIRIKLPSLTIRNLFQATTFMNITHLFFVIIIVFFFGCSKPLKESKSKEFEISNEKFKLENGLEVIFHIDKSDPVVAVALTAHVGSAREKEGRTGFAHLFEHLLFLESENLGKGGLDKMSARIGGSGANGSTSRDRTNYFQTVPKDALEKMLWAEADKLGWFINTVTEPVLAKEKQVVKNEKRQSIDNRPYGHAQYVIDKNLYPTNHPYNWQVIGSLEDLQNATLDDVKEFFKKWYVPNNVTLVVSGDFEVSQAKEWVKKYFDEIPRGGDISEVKPLPIKIEKTKKLYHEDNFARLPELRMVWPTVENFHPDSYPLTVLARYLTQGKEAPMYQVLVEDQKLTSGASMFNFSSELAGAMQLVVRAFPGKNLNEVEKAIFESFAKFEKEGFLQADLDRIKASQETAFYNRLSSVVGKGFQLAQYNIFANDPNFVSEDIKNILEVTTDDVKRVYEKYIKGKQLIATSFVPKGQLDLALQGSIKAEVVEEKVVHGAEENFDASAVATYEKTPSSFDRSIEPAYGDKLETVIPDYWKKELSNGMKLYGIQNGEVPLISFNMIIDGGGSHLKVEQAGLVNLLATLMNKGTADKTPAELEADLQKLGASLNVVGNNESIRIVGNTLAKNYEQLIELLEEILLKPRWDNKEFELAKESILSEITDRKAIPNAIANDAFNLLMYGKDDIRSKSILGTVESVKKLTIADLKAYFEQYISPSITRFHIVGDLDQSSVLTGLVELETKWNKKQVELPVLEAPNLIEKSQIYFYDVPNAKQSVLSVGYPTIPETDAEYYPATVANYILGGGGFASRLTQELREGKGYTYGVSSGFSGNKQNGVFNISSGVRTNVTLESMELIKDILDDYDQTYSAKDLETTKSFLIKSGAREFETANAKLNMLQNISYYSWEADYVKKRQNIVKNMKLNEIKEISKKYFDAQKMIWLVVGDKETQFKRLEKLGFGQPILINDRISDTGSVELK